MHNRVKTHFPSENNPTQTESQIDRVTVSPIDSVTETHSFIHTYRYKTRQDKTKRGQDKHKHKPSQEKRREEKKDTNRQYKDETRQARQK
jgi:hypothetical protein